MGLTCAEVGVRMSTARALSHDGYILCLLLSQGTGRVIVRRGYPQTKKRTPQKFRAADYMGGMYCCGSQLGLGLDPSSATSWLCDLSQISQALCALDSSSVGVIVRME